MVARGNFASLIKQQGGKVFHLHLLEKGGFNVLATYSSADIAKLEDARRYIVRSSAAGEDSVDQTAAGRNHSELSVKKTDVSQAIKKVKSGYVFGDVAIQLDITQEMTYSGVAYTNLNGNYVIAIGRKNMVQAIVEGGDPETEILINGSQYSLKNRPVNPHLMDSLKEELDRIEQYFGRPMDVEFAFVEEDIIDLQARPLPNPTDKALKEHEKRRLNELFSKTQQYNLDEIVLGVGNYREILGDEAATQLSTTTFNYIFSGDGDTVLGAVQLGRNEMGYDIGTEIFPWVLTLGSKVYFNFVGDALQFRPKGTSLEDLVHIINKIYLAQVRGDPDLINYPELHLYIQFPEQAEAVGLDPEPYRQLAEKNRYAIKHVEKLTMPPIKKIAKNYEDIERCLSEINATLDDMRTDSAKKYVQAARLAFFAMEDLRLTLANLPTQEFEEMMKAYSAHDLVNLRDNIAYDQSIGSFEMPEQEEYRYLGSFELTLPRGYPPKRHFKQGRPIKNKALRNKIEGLRDILEYREKVKFFLFRDYDYLSQLYNQLGDLSGFGEDIYMLEANELDSLKKESVLAYYRIELRKLMKGKELFSDPVFGKDLEHGIERHYEKKPQLIFGKLPPDCKMAIGTDAYIVNAVDQTVDIPAGTKVVMVPDNVRPGSHLFTVLSDYGIPVISVPKVELKQMKDRTHTNIKEVDDYVQLNYD